MITNVTGSPGATGNGIDSVELNADYTLTVHYTNGGSETVGPIRGQPGATGNGIDRVELNADYTLTIHYTDGNSETVGPIRGEKGDPGITVHTGTLTAAGWTSATQTLSVSGLAADDFVLIAAAPASTAAYTASRVQAYEQRAGEIVFRYLGDAPTVNLSVFIAIGGVNNAV